MAEVCQYEYLGVSHDQYIVFDIVAGVLADLADRALVSVVQVYFRFCVDRTT